MDVLVKMGVRKGTINTIGNTVDDMKESADKHVHQAEGGILALDNAGKKVLLLHGNIDRAFDDGLIKKGLTPNDVRALLKKWIERAFNVVDNLKDKASTLKLEALGKQRAFQDVIDYSQKLLKEAENKEAGIIAAMNGEVVESNISGKQKGRIPGVHPGKSIKSQRLGIVKDITKAPKGPVTDAAVVEVPAPETDKPAIEVVDVTEEEPVKATDDTVDIKADAEVKTEPAELKSSAQFEWSEIPAEEQTEAPVENSSPDKKRGVKRRPKAVDRAKASRRQ